MRKIGVAAIAFLLLWGITACTNAAAPSPNDLGEFRDVRVGYFSITTGEITDIVTYLSSTELSGRRSGTDGGMLAGDFIEKDSGLIILTGPTGSGKSTTLAAMLDRLNTLVKGQSGDINFFGVNLFYNLKSIFNNGQVSQTQKVHL